MEMRIGQTASEVTQDPSDSSTYRFIHIVVSETATDGQSSIDSPRFVLGLQSDEYGNEYSTIQKASTGERVLPGADEYMTTVKLIQSLREEL